MIEESNDYFFKSDENDLRIFFRIMNEIFAFDNIATLKQQSLRSKVFDNLIVDSQNEWSSY